MTRTKRQSINYNLPFPRELRIRIKELQRLRELRNEFNALNLRHFRNAAHELRDLMVPPGNRLEELHGDLAGQHSIRMNDQFRVIFKWKDGNAHDVRVKDYH